MLPTWSAELAVPLPKGAKSAAAFSLFTRFFSCICKENNQAIDYCKAPTSLLPCMHRSSLPLEIKKKIPVVKNAVDSLLLPEWLQEKSAQQDRLDWHQQACIHRMDFGQHITLVMRQQVAQWHQLTGRSASHVLT